METVNKFDNEYNISSSIQEAGRITKEKYDELDDKYDISDKVDQAKDYVKDISNQFNKWLKDQ